MYLYLKFPNGARQTDSAAPAMHAVNELCKKLEINVDVITILNIL